MLAKITVSVLVLLLVCNFVSSACDRDQNIQFKNPLYLNYGDGFFYIQGLTNGESVVIYKHPDDRRVFGQYTFKDEKCQYETVYYYVLDGKYEFTNPFITDEKNFNITNKINFVRNGGNYEIEYNVNPNGFGFRHNLGLSVERTILPDPVIKNLPAVQPGKEIFPDFNTVGKQNLKVSYLKTGENYIQFITRRNQFWSMEGQYTFRTSDKRYHSITYEVPLDEFDYPVMTIREYEVSTDKNFYKTGTLGLDFNGKQMDVRYFVNKDGFHVSNLKMQGAPADLIDQSPLPLLNNRITRNQPRYRANAANNRPVRT